MREPDQRRGGGGRSVLSLKVYQGRSKACFSEHAPHSPTPAATDNPLKLAGIVGFKCPTPAATDRQTDRQTDHHLSYVMMIVIWVNHMF